MNPSPRSHRRASPPRDLASTVHPGVRLWLERSDGDGSAFELWLPSSPPDRQNGMPQHEVATA